MVQAIKQASSTGKSLLYKVRKAMSRTTRVLLAFLAISSVTLLATVITSSVASALGPIAASPNPGPNPFSYNEFIDGNSYRANVDSRGAVAVGGNLTITSSFAVADGPNISYTCADDTLVVGGSIEPAATSAELSMGQGTALYGGTANGVSIYSNSTPQCNPPSVKGTTNFTPAWTAAVNDSSTWAATAANGTASIAASQLTLKGTSTTTNYFTITAAELEGAGTVNIEVPSGSTTIINVTGTTYTNSVTNIHFNGVDATDANDEATLWNFPTATSLSFENGVQWEGAILAPDAVVQFNNGKVDGNLIAAQLGTSTNPANVETHERYFVPPPMVPPTTTTTLPPTTTTTLPPTTTSTTTTLPPTTTSTTTTLPPTTTSTTTTVPPTTTSTTTTVPPTTTSTTTTVPPTTTSTTTTTLLTTKATHQKRKVEKKKAHKKIEVKAKTKVVPIPKPTKKIVTGATTVHTGEPWSGSNLYLLLLALSGFLLTVMGLLGKKYRFRRT